MPTTTNYVPCFEFEHNNDLVLMLMMQMDLAAQIERQLDGLSDDARMAAFASAAEGMCQMNGDSAGVSLDDVS